jgi:succinoglycan biosynthesis transport protein ExoP
MDELRQVSVQRGGWWFKLRAASLRFQRLFARFWWILFFSTAAGLAISAWVIFQQKAVFVSTGRMMVSGGIKLQEGAVFSEELANFLGTQIELMKSEEVRTRAAARLGSTEPQLQPVPMTLTVSQMPQTSIFVLSGSGSEAEYTQKLLDAIMTEYITTKKELRSSKSETTQTAIMDEVSKVESDMRQEEQELLDFQKENNVGYLEKEGNSAGSYLATLNRQLADLKTQYQLLDSLDIDQIIERRQNDPQHGGDTTAPAVADPDSQGLTGNMTEPETEYLQAKQQLSLLKAQRDESAKVLRPKHPQIVEMNEKISEQETLIASFRSQSVERLKSNRDAIKSQIEQLPSVIKEWESKALLLSERLAEYNRVKANLDRSKSLYDRLVNNLQDVNVTRNVDQDLVSILAKASPAHAIIPGLVVMLILGASGGLLVGISVLVLMDQIDDRVASAIDLQSGFDERILAQIPNEKHAGQLEPLREKDPRHGFAEALRALRSSLLYMPFEGERPKTLLITSAAPNEGKTTIALNLAITMALANVRVLLVDADLRRGSLHQWFERKSEPGLTDLLSGKVPQDKCILPTSIPNLDLLPRGVAVPNPGELFLGTSLNQFLRDVYPSYEYVIFDSSPVMATDDTSSLAPKLDAAIFVLRFSQSSARLSRKALEQLRDRQTNIIGLVCNGLSRGHQEYYHYKYPEYYSVGQNVA